MTSIKRSKSKSRLVMDTVKADILSGKLRAGDRIKSVRELAARFGVSARSAQTACELLEQAGLLECRHGAGTYVRQSKADRDNTIFFLVPNSAHLTLAHETSVMLRQILAGAIRGAAPGQMVVPVPVTRNNVISIEKNPGAIDWAALERIPSGANVFISGMWYAGIMPFLVERGVRGVFMSAQFEHEYPNAQKILRQTAWSLITIDRRAAMRRVIEFFHAAGKKRPAVIKRVPNQPDHPFRLGCLDGFDVCRLPFDNRLFQEYHSNSTEAWGAMILSLRKKTGCDALILCAPELARAALSVLTCKAHLKIPDDIAVIAFRDLPEYRDMQPALSAFDFPWRDIGFEIVRICNERNTTGAEVRFHASIVERASTMKGRKK